MSMPEPRRGSDALQIVLLAERPELAEAVAGWLWQQWPAAIGPSRAQALAIVQSRANARRLPLAIVALQGELPVGTASLVEDRLPGANVWSPFLGGMLVVPAWRRCGIGAALCRRAEAEAAQLGYRELFLYTENQAAFYLRCGWQMERAVLRALWRRSLPVIDVGRTA